MTAAELLVLARKNHKDAALNLALATAMKDPARVLEATNTHEKAALALTLAVMQRMLEERP